MPKQEPNITLRDLYTFLVCMAIISSALILPKFNLSSFFNNFYYLIQFDSQNYQYYNPPIFFSIGEALAAIAILFAVYQFKRDKWSLALKIRNYIEPTVFTSIILGILFSIYSSIIPLFHAPHNVFQLSIFWQIISSVLITFGVIFLFLKANNKNLFNKRTSRKFYETLVWEISRPDDERLDLALNVLLDNFENICKFASKEDLKLEMNRSARSILDVILSDRSMVKLLTTKRFDGLMYILFIIKKYDINRGHSPKGIPMIFQGLFLDPDSFLYKQLDYNGLALSANIYDNIFESSMLLNNFDLFGYPTLGFSARRDIDQAMTSVFIQALSKSIKTYLKTGEIPVRHINNGIEYLSNMFGVICSNIKDEQDAGKVKRYGTDSNWWLLHNIVRFLGHDYLFIGHRERFNEKDAVLNKDIIALEKTAQTADFYSDLAINEAIAAALYRAFEQLSQIEKGADTYDLVLDLLHGMTSEPNLREGYMLPFTKRMWEQIGKNVLGRYYPMVLKPYLNFIGFCLAGDPGQRKGWSGEEAEKMRRLLYVDLKPQLDANEKMIDDTLMKEALLPDCMDYKDGKFTYTMGFGRGPTVIITPPPQGAESALKDINWKDYHSSV
ncbi:MAG TPA: hypothetical protein VGO63_02075 [Candidatus Paceibacterota bacterium]|jgi:hypothetical protein|nr:hypothetical protein [Candidatus Paceibacterota bacterium]